jgi:hypothetical protein
MPAAPILIVAGRRNPLAPNGAMLARRIRQARMAESLMIDTDAGHDPGALSEPTLLDQVIDCAAGFLLGVDTR